MSAWVATPTRTWKPNLEADYLRDLWARLCGTIAPTDSHKELGIATGWVRPDHRTHLTLTGARAGKGLGWSSLQHLPAHAKASTEGRPCQDSWDLGLGAGLTGKLRVFLLGCFFHCWVWELGLEMGQSGNRLSWVPTGKCQAWVWAMSGWTTTTHGRHKIQGWEQVC